MEDLTKQSSGMVQCLKDCGCDDKAIEKYLSYTAEARSRDQNRLLLRQRRFLMNDLHSIQKKIDCIDYTIRQLELMVKEKEQSENQQEERCRL